MRNLLCVDTQMWLRQHTQHSSSGKSSQWAVGRSEGHWSGPVLSGLFRACCNGLKSVTLMDALHFPIIGTHGAQLWKVQRPRGNGSSVGLCPFLCLSSYLLCFPGSFCKSLHFQRSPSSDWLSFSVSQFQTPETEDLMGRLWSGTHTQPNQVDFSGEGP